MSDLSLDSERRCQNTFTPSAHSFAHSFIHSPIHLFMPSFIYSLNSGVLRTFLLLTCSVLNEHFSRQGRNERLSLPLPGISWPRSGPVSSRGSPSLPPPKGDPGRSLDV